MPGCPHCEYDAESITAFFYYNHADGEGHDAPPRLTEHSEAFLVCPDCDTILGANGSRNPY